MTFFCVCVFTIEHHVCGGQIYVCAHITMTAYIYTVHVEVRGQCWATLSVTPLFRGGQGLLWNLELAISARLSSQQAMVLPASTSIQGITSACWHAPLFYMGDRDLNSRFYALPANALLTDHVPSLWVHLYLGSLWFLFCFYHFGLVSVCFALDSPSGIILSWD